MSVGAASMLLEHPALSEAAAGPLLDLACGSGRNARALAGRGWPTLALDRDESALRGLCRSAREARWPLRAARCDLETSRGIPIQTGTCSAVLVFRFLFRPLSTEIVRVLRPGGVLIYETFTVAQRELGWGPRRDAFCLKPGELPTLFPGFEILMNEEGVFSGANSGPAALARLVARKPREV